MNPRCRSGIDDRCMGLGEFGVYGSHWMYWYGIKKFIACLNLDTVKRSLSMYVENADCNWYCNVFSSQKVVKVKNESVCKNYRQSLIMGGHLQIIHTGSWKPNPSPDCEHSKHHTISCTFAKKHAPFQSRVSKMLKTPFLD